MLNPIEHSVFLCEECATKSGHGKYVKITYSSSGGYSPIWESRLCEHLTVEDVMDYLGIPDAESSDAGNLDYDLETKDKLHNETQSNTD